MLKPTNIFLLAFCLLSLISSQYISAQKLLHSDYYQGHVYMSGFKWDKPSYGTDSSFAIVEIPAHLVSLPVRKAYLIGMAQVGYSGFKLGTGEMSINGQLLQADTGLHRVSPWRRVLKPNFLAEDYRSVLAIDVTHLNLSSPQLVLKYHPAPPPATFNMMPQGMHTAQLYIEFEDINEPYIHTQLYASDVKIDSLMDFYFPGLHTVNNQQETMFMFNSFGLSNSYNPNGAYWGNGYTPQYYNTYFNGDYLGRIFSDATEFWLLGPLADGYYKANALQGLSYGDNPDAQFHGSDLISNFQSLVPDSITYFSFQTVRKTDYFPEDFCPVSFGIAYVPHCYYSEPVSYWANKEVACIGDTLQIAVTGGVAYEWKTAEPLNGATAADAYFIVDTTEAYICEITNASGCKTSIVHRIEIYPPTTFDVEKTASSCMKNTGELWIRNLPENNQPYALWVNQKFYPTGGLYANQLQAGTQEIVIQDKYGCTSTKTVHIAALDAYQANYTVLPTSGIKPLTVTLQNNSDVSTWWSMPPDWLDSSSSVLYTFADTGAYVVQLIAGEDPCKDTTLITIVVFDSAQVQIPNVFTPNGDGQNDVFSIQQQGVQEVNFVIYNRWGNIVHQIQTLPTQKEVLIWDGGNASAGTYFYTATLIDMQNNTHERKGFIQLFKE